MVPNRMVLVSRAMPASVTQESVGPAGRHRPWPRSGRTGRRRSSPSCSAARRDGELIGVARALLGFDEDTEVEEAHGFHP